MKIGIDARHLAGMKGTGGSRVLDSCLRAFAAHDPSSEFFLYNRFSRPCWTATSAGRMLSPILADAVAKNAWLPFWSRRHALDALLHVLPPVSFTERRTPQLCYILDVPEDEEERTFASMIYNHVYIRGSCRHATRVLAISQHAANMIVERLGVDADKVRVPYLCADLQAIRNCSAFHGFENREGYFLGIISRLGWRKNPSAYLETYRRVPKEVRKDFPLVLIGSVSAPSDLSGFVDEKALAELSDDLKCLGRVSDSILMSYLKGASALLFPSRHEGFGLPILEAVAAGTPVVASDIPVFQELFSGVASLFPVEDYEAMANQLVSIANGWRLDLQGDHVMKWLDRFSFSSYVGRMKQIMEEVCN